MIDLDRLAFTGPGLTWMFLRRLYLRGSVDRVPVAETAAAIPRARVRMKPVVVLTIVLAGFWPARLRL